MGRKVQVGKDRAGWFRGSRWLLEFFLRFRIELRTWIGGQFSLFGVAEHLVLRLWACFL